MKTGIGLGAVKRFGTRYGRTPKHKLAKIEIEQRKPQKCPYCLKPKAKRLAAGIWQCMKCNAKFAGKAYALEEIILVKKSEEESPEEILEAKKEAEEVAVEV